jgi:hypothetical protein
VCRRSYPGFISAICESRNVRGLLYDFAWIESASHPFISFAKRELDACRTRHELFLCRPLRTRLSPTSAHIFEKNTTSTSRETCTMYFLSGFSHSTLIFADGNFLHNHLTDASVTIGIRPSKWNQCCSASLRPRMAEALSTNSCVVISGKGLWLTIVRLLFAAA